MGGTALDRIVRDSGVPELVDVLSERLAPTDLQTLMMEVYRRRAEASPKELLDRMERDRFCRPADVAPEAVAAFESLARSLLPEGFEAVELSPLCPLGTNSVIATVAQNKVVSTARNTEVVADSTAVLALVAALRRRQLRSSPEDRNQTVNLATAQRQVRAQRWDDPQARAHFRLLALVSAGRSRGSHAFEAETLTAHIGYQVDLVHRRRPGCRLVVGVTDLCGRDELWQERVVKVLADRFPGLDVSLDPSRESGRGYYVDVCFKLHLIDGIGEKVELGDGGCTTWTRQLLSDTKERLTISGLGVERAIS